MLKYIYLLLFSTTALAQGVFINNNYPRWGTIQGTLSSQADLQAALTSANSNASWGSITGTLSNQTDLQSALNLKTNLTTFNAHATDTANPHAVTKAQVGLSNVDNTSDANKPVSIAQQAALDLKEDEANKATDFSVLNNVLYPSVQAVYNLVMSMSADSVGGIPDGVTLSAANKVDFTQSKQGLLMQTYKTAAFAAGSYNGGGTGSKGFVSFWDYDLMPFSSLTNLNFSVKNLQDELGASLAGNIYWNILGNFNTGYTSLATDYVNIVIDGLSEHKANPLKYFNPSQSVYTDYNFGASELANERMVKCVGGIEGVTNLVNAAGTAVASMSGTFTSGSPIVTGLSLTDSMTVGQYIADATNGEYPLSSKVPAGARILSIDSPTQITMDVNAQGTSGTQTVMFYGGIAPVSRSATANGTTTLTVSNTDDLILNMGVTCATCPAGSYIVSKVRDVSITLNNSVPAGSPTLSFLPIGKTGCPGNGTNIGITWAQLVANNPNGYFANTAPTVAGGWAAADGGWTANAKFGAFNLIMNGSTTLQNRTNAIKSATINSDVYKFFLY